MITGKMYDVLKFIALVALPALGALYFALAGIWNLPSPEQVVGTITVVDTALGGLLHVSSQSFNSSTASGTLGIHETEEGKMYNLEIHDDPELELDGKKRVVFNVKKTKEPAKPSTTRSRAKAARKNATTK
jgi:hypothetical protein